MSFETIYPNGNATVTVIAGDSIAVQSLGIATVFQRVGYPEFPETLDRIGTVEGEETVFGPYAAGATIVIEAGASPVFYATGTGPVVGNNGRWQSQPTPGTLNATGTLTTDLILTGIVTSTTAAAVTGTLETAATVLATTQMEDDDSFDWSVINTGGAGFAFTVAADGGGTHTVVGLMTVADLTVGMFRTRRVSSTAVVTYRIG